MRRTSLFTALLFSCLLAQGQYWTQLADVPIPVVAPYGFSVGERNFMGGGALNVVPLVLTDQLYEYDAATDQWFTRAPLPGQTRYGAPGFSIEQTGKGYVVCGWHNNVPQVQLNDLWEYDPLLDNWTQKATFPGPPRYSLVSVGTATKAYAGLGYNPWMNDWYEYDPVTDIWTQKASFPGVARQACNAFHLNGHVYVGMGATNVIGSNADLFNDLYQYDPATDTWTQVAPLPGLPRAASYYFSTCGLAYLMGGIAFDSLGNQAILKDFWSYDPFTDMWDQLPDFPGSVMNSGTSFSIESAGYLGTGRTGYLPNAWVADSLTAEFWEYKGCSFTGMNSLGTEPDVRAYMNGSVLITTWSAIPDDVSISVHDALGRKLSNGVRVSGQQGFARTDLETMAPGILLVDWQAANRRVIRRLFVE